MFHWTSFIATQQRRISHLLTSCSVHHFSMHNGYFTRCPLMLSWSILSYQGPRWETVMDGQYHDQIMDALWNHQSWLCQHSPHHYNKHEAITTCDSAFLFAFATITQYWGLPAHTTAMSHPYTTSPSDIFAQFHLKYAIPRRPTISLIAHDYGFVKTNLSKHNLTKLANNKATKKL